MNRNRTWVIAAALALLTMASTAFAGTLDKGASELQGSVGFTSTSFTFDVPGAKLDNQTLFTADVKYGWCLTNNWELAPQLMVSSMSSGGNTASNYAGALSGIYNFALAGNNTVPFLEVGVGFGSIKVGSSSASSQSYSILPLASGGVRFLVGNSASINAAVVYRRESTKFDATLSSVAYTETDNVFGVQLGLSVFPMGFGKK